MDNDWRNARIEEAAKAIWAATDAITWENTTEDMRDSCRVEARAALAVFEKALGEATVTPTAHEVTTDEREALVTAAYGVINSHYWSTTGQPGVCAGCGYDIDDEPAGTMAEHRAEKLFEAGLLRRSAEPSARMIDTYDDAALRAAFNLPTTQGEPSDVQVKAFTDAEWEHRFMVFHGGWACKCGWDIPGPKLTTDEAAKRHREHQVRAALRAAGEVR